MTTWIAPANPSAGDLNRIEAGIGASEAGVVQAAGDMVAATGPGVLQRVPVGSAGSALTVVGGAPAWAPAPAVDPTEDLALPGWGAMEVYR